MKIVHLIFSLQNGGAEYQLSELASAQSAAGHKVNIIYVERPDTYTLPNKGEIKYLKLGISSNYDLRLFFKVFSLLYRLKPNIVQSWIPMMDVVAGVLCPILNIPWLMREPSSEGNYTKKKLTFLVREFLARKYAFVISNSAGGFEYWHHKMPTDRLFLGTNIIRTPDISTIPNRESDIPTQYILYAGRLVKSKNVNQLIEAFRITQKQNKNVSLLICGDGDEKKALEYLVNTYSLGGRIRFLGWREHPELMYLIKNAICFVYISQFEGFPNMPALASKIGCPLVLSRILAHETLFGQSAFYYDGSTQDLANVLDQIIHGNSELTVKVQSALAKLSSTEPDTVRVLYESVYNSIIASNQ